MHAARTARLRPAAQSDLGQHLPRDECNASDVVPRNARPGIEIDPQLVGMLEIAGAHRVRMELDAAEVHDPREAGGVVDDDFLGRSPRWE